MKRVGVFSALFISVLDINAACHFKTKAIISLVKKLSLDMKKYVTIFNCPKFKNIVYCKVIFYIVIYKFVIFEQIM